jgi:hypothetical protein
LGDFGRLIFRARGRNNHALPKAAAIQLKAERTRGHSCPNIPPINVIGNKQQKTTAATHQGAGKNRTVAAGRTTAEPKAKQTIPLVRSNPQMPSPANNQAEINPENAHVAAKAIPHTVS